MRDKSTVFDPQNCDQGHWFTWGLHDRISDSGECDLWKRVLSESWDQIQTIRVQMAYNCNGRLFILIKICLIFVFRLFCVRLTWFAIILMLVGLTRKNIFSVILVSVYFRVLQGPKESSYRHMRSFFVCRTDQRSRLVVQEVSSFYLQLINQYLISVVNLNTLISKRLPQSFGSTTSTSMVRILCLWTKTNVNW